MIAQMLSDMFVIGVPVIEKIARTLLVYLLLLLCLRLAGKRELAQLNPFDFVVLLLLSNTVQNAIIGNDNSFTGGAVGVITLIVFNNLVVRYLFRHQRTERALVGDDTPLIGKGQIDNAELRKELITYHQLMVAARKQGFESLDDVEWADLDPSGSFIFKRKTASMDSTQQREIIERLDQISHELAVLRGAQANGAQAQ